ncbi:hypothetical protein V8G54_000828 [Vigna mungo]|uniref:Hexosyltransferase n=1 Tax=Vigna mungo TaxID=3915 RepID=A0AAQ3S7M4_VIGMU
MEDVSMGMWVEEFNSSRAVDYVHSLKFCQFGCIEDYYTAHYQSPRQMTSRPPAVNDGDGNVLAGDRQWLVSPVIESMSPNDCFPSSTRRTKGVLTSWPTMGPTVSDGIDNGFVDDSRRPV